MPVKEKYRKNRKPYKSAVLRVLLSGSTYQVDLEEGEVYSGKTGKPLFRYYGEPTPPDLLDDSFKTESNLHPWVRIYVNGNYMPLPLSHVIWMTGNRRVVPRGFHIHHRNINPNDNRFINLYALSDKDHRKLHAAYRNGDSNGDNNGDIINDGTPF